MQICQPRTASQSWNTDNWCWMDWAAAGVTALFAVMVLVLLLVLGRIVWDMR